VNQVESEEKNPAGDEPEEVIDLDIRIEDPPSDGQARDAGKPGGPPVTESSWTMMI